MLDKTFRIPKENYRIAIAGDTLGDAQFTDHTMFKQGIAKIVEGTGYTPKIFINEAHLVDWANKKTDGVSNLNTIALVVYCYRLNDSYGEESDRGIEHALKAIKTKDPNLPFVALTEYDDLERAARLGQLGLDAYVTRRNPKFILADVLNRYLKQSHSFEDRIVVASKFGGSADDFDFERDEKAVARMVRYSQELQAAGKHQFIWGVGGGKSADVWKRRMQKYGADYPLLAENYARHYADSLQANIDFLIYLSHGEFLPITPRNFADTSFNLESELNSGRVIVWGLAPRHLGLGLAEEINKLGYGDIVPRTSRGYPNIPMGDSDAQFTLIANFLNADIVNLIKRVDGPHKRDIFFAYSHAYKRWRHNIQRRIGISPPLEYVTFGDILDEKKLSLVGAEDKQHGHFLERSAAGLAMLFNMPGVHISHVFPREMYTQDGKHAFNGTPWPTSPDGTPLTDEEVIRMNLDEIIGGKTYPKIRHDNWKAIYPKIK